MSANIHEIDGTPLMRTRSYAFDPWHIFVESLPLLVDRAREAREDAVSYRNFDVGAVLLAVAGDFSSMAIVDGANTKPNKGKDKICAEKRNFGSAKRRGLTKAIGLVVCGMQQQDDSGLIAPTLHPCQDCRELIPDETIVVTIDPDQDRYEVHSGKELNDLHNRAAVGEELAPLTTFWDPGFKKWESNRTWYDALARDFSGDLYTTEAARIQAARIAITGVLP